MLILCIHVYFMQNQSAGYCESYPVTNYTLEFTEGPVPDSLMITSTQNTVTAQNLLDNEVYKVKVVVTNSMGNVSTSQEIICKLSLKLN